MVPRGHGAQLPVQKRGLAAALEPEMAREEAREEGEREAGGDAYDGSNGKLLFEGKTKGKVQCQMGYVHVDAIGWW